MLTARRLVMISIDEGVRRPRRGAGESLRRAVPPIQFEPALQVS